MPEFVNVARASDFQNGDRVVVEVKGHWVAVFKVGDAFYAIEDICTHDDGPLAEGERSEYTIECPRHGACFDIRTGAVLSMPAVTPVPRYETRLDGEDIQIKI